MPKFLKKIKLHCLFGLKSPVYDYIPSINNYYKITIYIYNINIKIFNILLNRNGHIGILYGNLSLLQNTDKTASVKKNPK